MRLQQSFTNTTKKATTTSTDNDTGNSNQVASLIDTEENENQSQSKPLVRNQSQDTERSITVRESLENSDQFSMEERREYERNNSVSSNVTSDDAILLDSESDIDNSILIGAPSTSRVQDPMWDPLGLREDDNRQEENNSQEENDSQGEEYYERVDRLNTSNIEDYPSTSFLNENIFKIIRKSINLNKALDVNLLSHETIKFLKDSSGKLLKTNLLFITKEDFENETFLKIKKSEINKCESINDRLNIYYDKNIHHSTVEKSLVASQNMIKILDEVTLFSNFRESQINYANIVEDFIVNKTSMFNGKILNGLLTGNIDNNIISSSRFDENLLDKQSKNENLTINHESCRIFYENITGFSILDADVLNENKKILIKNSDQLIGQLILNTGVSLYNIYPNSDSAFDLSYFQSRIPINSKELIKYPLIQVSNINNDRRIFYPNQEIFNIKKGSFVKDNVKLSYVDENYRNTFSDFSSNSYDSNNNVVYFLKHSVFGKMNPSITNITDNTDNTDNTNIFSIGLASSQIFNYTDTGNNSNFLAFTSQVPKNFDNNITRYLIKSNNEYSIFEVIYQDIHNKYKNAVLSPTFMIFPQRYFMSRHLKNMLSEDFVSSSIENIRSLRPDTGQDMGLMIQRDNETTERTVGIFNIKKAISDLFLDNFTLAENFESQITLVDVVNSDNEDVAYNVDGEILRSIYSGKIENKLAAVYYSLMKNSFYDNINTNESIFIRSNDQNEYNFIFDSDVINNDSLRNDVINAAVQEEFDVLLAESAHINNYNFRQENSDLLNDNFPEAIKNRVNDTIHNGHSIVPLKFSNEYPDNFSDLKNNKDHTVIKANNSYLSKSDIELFSFSTNDNGHPVDYSPNKNFWDPANLGYIDTFNNRWISGRLSDVDYVTGITNPKDIKLSFSDLTISISRVVNSIRRGLDTNSFKVFEDFIEKCKSKMQQGEKYSLLYDRYEETCIDTFEKSKFITNQQYYKNNYAKSFSYVENTSNSYYKNQNLNSNHIFTSKNYREFLSKIYTKSYLRNKSTVFYRILKDNEDIFKYSNYESDSLFGFDILLATTLSDVNNNNNKSIVDLIKMILASVIVKNSDIKSQISNIYRKPSELRPNVNTQIKDTNFKLYKDLIEIFGKKEVENIIKLIFSIENIKYQNNYIVKSFNAIKKEYLNMSASNGFGGVNIRKIPNFTFSLKFPFIKDILDDGKEIKKLYLPSLREIKNTDELKVAIKYFKDFATELSYNHDIFINEEQTGIIKSDIVEGKNIITGYNFNDSQGDPGSDLNISYYDYNNNSNDTPYDTAQESWNADVKIPYSVKGNAFIPFSYFYLTKQSNTFSNKIDLLCNNLISLFDINYSEFNTVNDVLDYIDQNEYFIKSLHEYLIVLSKIFLSSYNNYITLIIREFQQRFDNETSENSGNYLDDLADYVKNISFAYGNPALKEKAVSDISMLKNKIKLKDNGYIENDVFFTYEEFIENRTNNEIYTNRLYELQAAYKILNNSDISEAISHDIIHGYFLNYESNIRNIRNDIGKYESNISNITEEINKIQGININKENFKSMIKSEFYQNKISKDLQEIYFYKNLFKETFIENSAYNTLEEKYNNINLFNHRSYYYENKYKQSKLSLDYIVNNLDDNISQDIDVIKIPISYQIANKIGERGILQINILPVNIKYPEIEYKTLNYYYSPVFTDVTSNFFNILNGNVNSYVGMYDDSIEISKRYFVVNINTAIKEAEQCVREAARRTNIELEDNIVNTIANQLINDTLMSNCIKKTNYITQKFIDENTKKSSVNIENLINSSTLDIINSIKIKDIKKVFDNYKEDELLNKTPDVYYNIDSNKNMLENDEFYKKYIVNLDKDTANTEIVKSLIPNEYYDVFSLLVRRDDLQINDSKKSVDLRSISILNDIEKDLVFSFYISSRIL